MSKGKELTEAQITEYVVAQELGVAPSFESNVVFDNTSPTGAVYRFAGDDEAGIEASHEADRKRGAEREKVADRLRNRAPVAAPPPVVPPPVRPT